MKDVFISYSHFDKLFAERLANDLKRYKVIVSMDEIDLGAGDYIDEKLGDAIDDSKYFAIVLSRSSDKSYYQKRELSVALTKEFKEREIKILPLLLEDCQIPPFLRGKLYTDFREEEKYNVSLKELLKKLGIPSRRRIIFDESCKQSSWNGQPLANSGYNRIFQEVVKEFDVESNSSFNEKELWEDKILTEDTILILPQPYGIKIEIQHYEKLVNWVNRGGKLLLMGTYFMESHHHNNFNMLARRLGFEFGKDLLLPLNKEKQEDCRKHALSVNEKEYWIESCPISHGKENSILNGVNKIFFTSSCTVIPKIEPIFKISTTENVLHFIIDGITNDDGKVLHFKEFINTKTEPAVIGVGYNIGLGKVFAIGNWKVFINTLIKDPQAENIIFFKNIISWLFSES